MITTKYNERGLLTNNPNEHRGWLDNNKEGVDIRGSDESARKSTEAHGYIRNQTKSFEVRRKRSDLEGNVRNRMQPIVRNQSETRQHWPKRKRPPLRGLEQSEKGRTFRNASRLSKIRLKRLNAKLSNSGDVSIER